MLEPDFNLERLRVSMVAAQEESKGSNKLDFESKSHDRESLRKRRLDRLRRLILLESNLKEEERQPKIEKKKDQKELLEEPSAKDVLCHKRFKNHRD